MTDRTWKVVWKAATIGEAESIRLRLTSAEIPADVWDRHFAQMRPWLSLPWGGIRVVVPDDREMEALQILRGDTTVEFSDEELTREALAAEPETMPQRIPEPPINWSSVLMFILFGILGVVYLYGLLR